MGTWNQLLNDASSIWWSLSTSPCGSPLGHWTNHQLCLPAVLGYELAPFHGHQSAKPWHLVMVVWQPEPAAETLATPSVSIGILWHHFSLHGMSWYHNRTVICYLLILRKLFAFQSSERPTHTHVDGVTVQAARNDRCNYQLHGHLSHLEHWVRHYTTNVHGFAACIL